MIASVVVVATTGSAHEQPAYRIGDRVERRLHAGQATKGRPRLFVRELDLEQT